MSQMLTTPLFSRLIKLTSLLKLKHQPAASLSNFGSRQDRKRFYKNVSVCESFSNAMQTPKLYEINLDKKKLKTPSGKLFQVDNEHLAHMISHEWNSQLDTIKQTTMHLTSLVNTCMDNPNKLTKEGLIANLNDYLQTDTVLYFDSNSIEKLDQLQETKWRPIVDWFNARFNSNLLVQKEIGQLNENVNTVAQNAHKLTGKQNEFEAYLHKNFDLNTMIAFNYMCECLKSVILAVALLERRVESVEEACELANLEQAFQFEKWGKVEWYHDINEQELRSRVSAGLLFVYLSNSSKYLVVRNTHVDAASFV